MQMVDLKKQYEAYRSEIDQAMQRVLDQTSFIMGEDVKALEEELARFVGVKHAIGCASGTDALLLALKACGVGVGDEIVTTPFTFISTAEVISLLGARPVFVDIDSRTFNIDPALIKARITPRTKGIITVDLFGQCADHDAVMALARESGLFVIEDAAQSFGATCRGRKACALADIGCASFFPAKPLGCFGDGGMVFLNDDQKAAYLRSIRSHGSGKAKYEHDFIGMNSRLDTLQAAVLRVKFRHFPDEIAARQRIAARYAQQLARVCVPPFVADGQKSVYGQYSILVRERDRLQEALKRAGIPTAIYYPKPLHLQEAFRSLGYVRGDFPVSERVSAEILALPMHPFLSDEEIDFVSRAVGSFYA